MKDLIGKAEFLSRWIEDVLGILSSNPRTFGDLDPHGLELGLNFLRQKFIPEVSSGLELPLVAIICGGTNTGKSTLTNSLVEKVVSPSGGGLASFTKRNTGVGLPEQIDRVVKARPGWKTKPMREMFTDRQPSENNGLPGVFDQTFPVVYSDGVAEFPADLPLLLDTPDIDSSDTDCRRHSLSALLLADIVIWLTTQQKYKDKAGMTFLDDAMTMISRRIDLFNQFLPRHSEAFGDMKDFYLQRWPDSRAAHLRINEEPALKEDEFIPSASLKPLRELLTEITSEKSGLKAQNIRHGIKFAGQILVRGAQNFSDRRNECFELRKEIMDRLEETLFAKVRSLQGNDQPFELQAALVRVIGPRVQTSFGNFVNQVNQSALQVLNWTRTIFSDGEQNKKKVSTDPVFQRDSKDIFEAARCIESARYDLLENSRLRMTGGHPLHSRFHNDLRKIDFPSSEKLVEQLKKKFDEGYRDRILPLIGKFENDLARFCEENPGTLATLQAAVPGFSALTALGAAVISIHTFTILPGITEYLMGGIALPIFSKLEKLLPEKLLTFADQMSHQPFILRARENFARARASIFLEAAEWISQPVEELLSVSDLQEINVQALLRDLESEWLKHSSGEDSASGKKENPKVIELPAFPPKEEAE